MVFSNFLSSFISGRRWYSVLIFLFIFGGALRVFGLNYDSGHMIHPDERFISMVLHSQKALVSGVSYFDTERSTLNPHNIGHGFYVYGTLPLFLMQATAGLTGWLNYGSVHLAQRWTSVVFDLLMAFGVFFLLLRFFERKWALLFLFFYITCPFLIQQARFGTVDVVATCFATWVLVFIVLMKEARNPFYFSTMAGVMMGAALASKINAVVLLPFVFSVFLWRAYRGRRSTSQTVKLVYSGILFLLLTALVFRVFQPYAFQGPGFFDFGFNPKWIQNLATLREQGKVLDIGFPPSVQWLNRDWWYSSVDLVFWGIGFWMLPLLFFGIYSAFISKQNLNQKFRPIEFWIAVFVILHWLWQSAVPNPTMRYQLMIYPWIFFLSALGARRIFEFKWGRVCIVFFTAVQILWFLAFVSIHLKEDSRVQASRWIYENIPQGSKIAVETAWDMGLPFHMAGKPAPQSLYQYLQLELYERDSDQKTQRVGKLIQDADWIIMSSQRQWGSIGRLPLIYPWTEKWYRSLASCSDRFKTAAECYRSILSISDWKRDSHQSRLDSEFELAYIADRFPSIFGYKINTEYADEAFSVYDHSKVLIWKRLRKSE